MTKSITIIGGGLAGSEAAWQIASRGIQVDLFEMRPVRPTEAHLTDRLAELVCSNSMGSTLPDRALGILKHELLRMDSLIIRTAFKHALPAGAALAVSREEFSAEVTEMIYGHPNITVHREEVTAIPDGPVIVATGPLTSSSLTGQIQALTGQQYLYFYDAMAPIVVADSIDMTVAFRQSRYDRNSALGDDEGDYINCPFSKEEYERFVRAVLDAPKIELKGADKELERYFEGCMPIEALAARGDQSLAFGPMRPVGLRDPRTGRRPLRGRTVASGQCSQHALQHGRLPDQHQMGRPGGGSAVDPWPRQCRVRASGSDAPQHLRQQPDPAAGDTPEQRASMICSLPARSRGQKAMLAAPWGD